MTENIFVVGACATRKVPEGTRQEQKVHDLVAVWVTRNDSEAAADLAVRLSEEYAETFPTEWKERSVEAVTVTKEAIDRYKARLFSEGRVLSLWGYAMVTDFGDIRVGTVVASTREEAEYAAEAKHGAVCFRSRAITAEKIPRHFILPNIHDAAALFRDRLPSI